MKVYPFIAAEKAADSNVATACRLLSVSRSAFYTWSRREPSAHATRDEELAHAIRRVHRVSRGTYGAPRIHRQLQREGIICSRKRVARLMAQLGLEGCQRRRRRRRRYPMSPPRYR